MGNNRITYLLWVLMLVALPLNAQISGYIIDDATGDSIPYASVIYRGHNVAVASNLSGHYTIERHDGWQLTFSSVGYEPQTVAIGSQTKARLDIRLKPDTRTLKEVTVRAKRGKYSRKKLPPRSAPTSTTATSTSTTSTRR